jgi:hypothetical protein
MGKTEPREQSRSGATASRLRTTRHFALSGSRADLQNIFVTVHISPGAGAWPDDDDDDDEPGVYESESPPAVPPRGGGRSTPSAHQSASEPDSGARVILRPPPPRDREWTRREAVTVTPTSESRSPPHRAGTRPIEHDLDSRGYVEVGQKRRRHH